MTSIVFTRSEAIRRNVRVSMCPSPMARTGVAACAGSYADGWIVFENRDGDRIVDAQDELIRVYAALPAGFTITNRAGTRAAGNILSYQPDGSSGRTRTLLVCAPAGSEVPPRSVVLSNVGRPRLARDWGTCPAG
jgi:type IV fimbrial biogenesis protein FimT